MSMTTVIVIVLAMIMLILGVSLISKIMSFGTGMIDIAEKGTRDKLNRLLGEEGKTVAIMLPAGEAIGKPGGDSFNAPLVALSLGGIKTTRDSLKYEVYLDEEGGNECIEKNGLQLVKNFFIEDIKVFRNFDEYGQGEGGDKSYASINMRIPKGTALCIQKVLIDVKTKDGDSVGGTYFILKVARPTLF